MEEAVTEAEKRNKDKLNKVQAELAKKESSTKDLIARFEAIVEKRKEIKGMLADWERYYPGRTETIFRALGNVAPSHLMDHDLFDFRGLQGRVDDNAELPDIRVVNL